jgi:hypothetical protein
MKLICAICVVNSDKNGISPRKGPKARTEATVLYNGSSVCTACYLDVVARAHAAAAELTSGNGFTGLSEA